MLLCANSFKYCNLFKVAYRPIWKLGYFIQCLTKARLISPPYKISRAVRFYRIFVSYCHYLSFCLHKMTIFSSHENKPCTSWFGEKTIPSNLRDVHNLRQSKNNEILLSHLLSLSRFLIIHLIQGIIIIIKYILTR